MGLEHFGSLGLGSVIGWISVNRALVSETRPKDRWRSIAFALIFVTSGLSLAVEYSGLLAACIMAGSIVIAGMVRLQFTASLRLLVKNRTRK